MRIMILDYKLKGIRGLSSSLLEKIFDSEIQSLRNRDEDRISSYQLRIEKN